MGPNGSGKSTLSHVIAGKPGYDWTAFFAKGGVSALIGEPGAPPPGFRPAE